MLPYSGPFVRQGTMRTIDPATCPAMPAFAACIPGPRAAPGLQGGRRPRRHFDEHCGRPL
eukprot:6147793-Alexandrium_andersonii.AAC.1